MGAPTVAELVNTPGANVEESNVVASAEFPPRIVLRLLRSDGEIVSGVLVPVQAHKLSDDLLRAVAATMRRE